MASTEMATDMAVASRTASMRPRPVSGSYRFTDVPAGSGVSVFPNLLDRAFCADVVSAGESRLFRDSEIGVGRGPVRRDRKVRRSKEVQLPTDLSLPASRALAKLAPRLRAELASPIAFATAPLLLRYGPGDFFQPHQDNTRTPGGRPFRVGRLATYIFYLTSHVDAGKDDGAFDGGRLFLFRDFNPLAPEDRNPRKFALIPAAGDLVVFPSTMYHEAEPVVSGSRYCLLGWLFASKPPETPIGTEEAST